MPQKKNLELLIDMYARSSFLDEIPNASQSKTTRKEQYVPFLHDIRKFKETSEEISKEQVKQIRDDYENAIGKTNSIYLFLNTVYYDIEISGMPDYFKKELLIQIFTPLVNDKLYGSLDKIDKTDHRDKMKIELEKISKLSSNSPSVRSPAPASRSSSSTVDRFGSNNSEKVFGFSSSSTYGRKRKRKSTKTRGRKKKETTKKSSSNKSNSNRNRNRFNSRLAYPQGESPTSLGTKKKRKRNSSRTRRNAKKKV